MSERAALVMLCTHFLTRKTFPEAHTSRTFQQLLILRPGFTATNSETMSTAQVWCD
jgi:hypothetical protein